MRISYLLLFMTLIFFLNIIPNLRLLFFLLFVFRLKYMFFIVLFLLFVLSVFLADMFLLMEYEHFHLLNDSLVHYIYYNYFLTWFCHCLMSFNVLNFYSPLLLAFHGTNGIFPGFKITHSIFIILMTLCTLLCSLFSQTGIYAFLWGPCPFLFCFVLTTFYFEKKNTIPIEKYILS